LIYIPPKKDAEEEEQQLGPKAWLQEHILKSKILSGGVENRFLTRFTPSTVNLMTKAFELIEDAKFKKHMS